MLLLQNNLMIAIVNNGHARRFVSIARESGAGGGTIIPAKGTATGNFLRILGLGDTSKEMILMVIGGDLAEKIVEKVQSDGRVKGVVALLGSEKEENMASKWKMITIIVNTRKAGASGGTVTHARGTGTADDVKFLGVEIVPEKEMILILSEAEKTDKIVNAISSLKCLDEPGIGIIYTQDVTDFRNLDPKK